MKDASITVEEARAALALPRVPGRRSVVLNGREVSVALLGKILRAAGVATVPIAPASGEPAGRAETPAASQPAAPSIDEGKPHPVPFSRPYINSWKPDGSHVKSYVITWVDMKGEFHVKKYAAKGITAAITLHYMELQETAIVSVVCVI